MAEMTARMPDEYAMRSEVAALRRELCELRAIVGQFARRRDTPDSRLGPCWR